MEDNSELGCNMLAVNCCCCGGNIGNDIDGIAINIVKCKTCSTRYAKHEDRSQGVDAWSSETITPEFLQLLKDRRKIQSEQIINRYRIDLSGGVVMDYGCGQGAFVLALLESDIDAYGCDMSDAGFREDDVRRERFVIVQRPWEIPKGIPMHITTLLDVLEHAENPGKLLEAFKDAGCGRFIVKVPVTGGPIYLVSNLLAKLGWRSFLDKLFLVGDIAPHVVYFSERGIISLFERHGFRLQSKMKIAELGHELPGRIRGGNASASLLSRTVLGVAGRVLEMISPLWSDTEVFHFELVDKSK